MGWIYYEPLFHRLTSLQMRGATRFSGFHETKLLHHRAAISWWLYWLLLTVLSRELAKQRCMTKMSLILFRKCSR